MARGCSVTPSSHASATPRRRRIVGALSCPDPDRAIAPTPSGSRSRPRRCPDVIVAKAEHRTGIHLVVGDVVAGDSVPGEIDDLVPGPGLRNAGAVVRDNAVGDHQSDLRRAGHGSGGDT